MKTLGNLVWLLFGGFMIAVEYFILGVVLMVTVVGIPFGIQAIKLGQVAIWPFGATIVDAEQGSGCLNLVMNVIWFVFGGILLTITHLFWGVILCITIVGIPFGKQHFKMIPLALFPFGKRVM